MLETVVEVSEANIKDNAIVELQDILFERLLFEATDELSRDADIANFAMQSIAHTAVKANQAKTKIVTNWWGNKVRLRRMKGFIFFSYCFLHEV